MKKVLAVILIFALMLSGCAMGSADKNPTESNTPPAQEQTEATKPAPVPEEPTDPEGELTNVAHGDLEEETAYKFYLEQKTVDKVLFFNGEKSGNFLATTEDPAEAVDVFMEKAEDGARFYYMDGETKTYIEIEQYTNNSGNHRNHTDNLKAVFSARGFEDHCGFIVLPLEKAFRDIACEDGNVIFERLPVPSPHQVLPKGIGIKFKDGQDANDKQNGNSRVKWQHSSFLHKRFQFFFGCSVFKKMIH